ncbi:MAG: hypothetical protein KatS3mg128_0188 [Silanimonas sp.]|nr:MAG: hypothetical protein KatS3mg128_0188 [Silanimonas sp.]
MNQPDPARCPQRLASRRRRFLGAIGGGMLGSGAATLVVSALNAWSGKPSLLVWAGLAMGLPITVAGIVLINRVSD